MTVHRPRVVHRTARRQRRRLSEVLLRTGLKLAWGEARATARDWLRALVPRSAR